MLQLLFLHLHPLITCGTVSKLESGDAEPQGFERWEEEGSKGVQGGLLEWETDLGS